MKPEAKASATACVHCRFPVDGGGDFCCAGCETAHRIISGAGLADFYELRGDKSAGPPQAEIGLRANERMYLQTQVNALRSGGLQTVRLGVHGLYCAACVWLIERAISKHPGVADVVVNPARGHIDLTADERLDLIALSEKLESLGYRLGEPGAEAFDGSSELLVRTGIATAIALNAMMLGAALYLGLEKGWLHDVFVALSAALGAGSVIVGGGYFGRRAIAAIRHRAISLDVPIALGIALVFASSLWATATGRGGAIYFDTLAVFVALMLAGRLLQERLLRANRRRVDSNQRLADLRARVVEDGKPRSIRAVDLAVGDRILVAPGEIFPADVSLEDDRAGCRLEWITGESEPRLFRRGERIPAGASNASRQAITARVDAAIGDTALPTLLSPSQGDAVESARATSTRVATIYLVAVISAAAVGFVAWLAVTGDAPRALEVAAAVLVVTCPCALGIGAPLAFELIVGRLATRGAYIRTPDALAKLSSVGKLAFDKTGTLTERRLGLAEERALASLTSRELHVLYNLAARSAHPKSEVVAAAIDGRLDADIQTTEEPGLGISASVDNQLYQLGSRAWVTSTPDANRDTVFGREGSTLAVLDSSEALRPDAEAELSALCARGIQLSIVSGDQRDRVADIACQLPVALDQVVAEASPDDKAAWVRANDGGDLLFVGDGLNDAPALDLATASATPSLESPLVASRVDMYFSGRGLRPIRFALEGASLLSRIHRSQLIFVVVYNAAAVSLALAGLMQPWLAALLMPASSIAVTTKTALAVRKGLQWESSRS